MDEFDSLRKEWKIGKYMCKETKRGYAFDEQGVSRDPSASFLKVVMSAKGSYLFPLFSFPKNLPFHLPIYQELLSLTYSELKQVYWRVSF